MDRVRFSRRLNVCLGGRNDELLCSRVYINARLYGSFWIPLQYALDVLFWHENEHCRQCYLWEARQCRKLTKHKSVAVKANETASSLSEWLGGNI